MQQNLPAHGTISPALVCSLDHIYILLSKYTTVYLSMKGYHL